MIRLLFALSLVLTLPLEAAPRRRAASVPLYPQCTMVTGTAGVTFTRDEGRTLAPSSTPLRGIKYTYGVVALDTPHTLMAWHDDDLLLSTDAGCSWRVVYSNFEWDFPPTLTAAKGGRVYAWSENRSFLVRYDRNGAVPLRQPVPFVGFGVDPNDADHIRGGGDDGTIWDSRDGGTTWDPLGRLDGSIGYYRFAFDPKNLDHIVAGTVINGAHVSRDGGRTWTRAQGMGGPSVNAFNLVVSPADSNTVWAMALDMSNNSDRHIFLSRDGGATYTPVVADSATVNLINGPTMAAHPTNPNVLYFVFGTHTMGYGTDLFRYDAATKSLTMTHNEQHDINAIAFAKDDPRVMYLGLERVEGR